MPEPQLPELGPDQIRLENGDVREMTEGEMLQRQIEENTSGTLETTRRMLALCEEAKESGLQTLVMLDDQGEQLDKINEGMDEINRDMLEAEKNLDDLNKCCGLCVLPWDKVPGFGAKDSTFKENDDGAVNAEGPRMLVDQNGMGPSGGFVTKITNDAMEDEMDNNLQEVSGMIGNLRNMAVDMGSEISQQNRTVDSIQSKAKSNEERIKKANDQATKLLK